jgi:hypothetical protein
MNSKRIILVFAVIIMCLFLYGQVSLQVGIAKIDITPDIPFMLYGYNARKTPSECILDSLSSRAIVFENVGKKFVSGYLPPAGLYKEGGYEVTSTRFEIGSAEKVVKETLRMLYNLE